MKKKNEKRRRDGKAVRIQGDDAIADRLPVGLRSGIEAVKLLVVHGEDELLGVIRCVAVGRRPCRVALCHGFGKGGEGTAQVYVVLGGFVGDLDLRIVPALIACGEPAALGLQREDEVRRTHRRLKVLRPLLLGRALRCSAQRHDRPRHVPRGGGDGVGVLLPPPVLPEAWQAHRHLSRCDGVTGVASGIAADVGISKPSVLKGPIVRLCKDDGVRDPLCVPLCAHAREHDDGHGVVVQVGAVGGLVPLVRAGNEALALLRLCGKEPRRLRKLGYLRSRQGHLHRTPAAGTQQRKGDEQGKHSPQRFRSFIHSSLRVSLSCCDSPSSHSPPPALPVERYHVKRWGCMLRAYRRCYPLSAPSSKGARPREHMSSYVLMLSYA